MSTVSTVRESLLFLNPEFRPGLNLTVRNGSKWDKLITELPMEVDVKKTGEEDKILEEAEIVGKMVIPADTIPPQLLELEHAVECRNWYGLVKVMKDAYGEQWSENSMVTLVFFYIN